MPSPRPLPAGKLHAPCDPASLPWQNSDQIPLPGEGKTTLSVFQPRVVRTLSLALSINSPGYHVFFCGDPGLGRLQTLLSWLKPKATRRPAPADMVYLHNFDSPDEPILISLPSGNGKKLKSAIKEFVELLGEEAERCLSSPSMARKQSALHSRFHTKRAELLDKINELATDKGFKLDMDDNGLVSLAPLSLTRKSSRAVRHEWQKRGAALTNELTPFMSELAKLEETYREDEKHLEADAMEMALKNIFPRLEQKISHLADSPVFKTFLNALKNDFLQHADFFLSQEKFPPDSQDAPESNPLSRYNANIFVDNSDTAGAPVIVEDNPTSINLLGVIEREQEMGALVTDFTLIRSGSLHRANGGFLILRALDILRHQTAWEGLLRALQAGSTLIEDNSEYGEYAIRAKGIRPQPVSLDVKVIIIGDLDLYETLVTSDERFPKIFGLMAHMAEDAPRNAASIRSWLLEIGRIIKKGSLPAFDASALAWLVRFGSLVCEDQRRLTLKFPLIRQYMREASSIAKCRARTSVDATLLEEAHQARISRDNLIEELYLEDYHRQLIKVKASGQAIGQINGLSVTWHGDYEFGLPHRISCAVGVGNDGVIDLEREADLGGPIHTKAMMILKSFLTGFFAGSKPLVFSASLYFEQSYAEIEGDSASGAELAALLSALANVPARLDLAFTGAVSHAGEIMAVGGVNCKVEGFYKVCAHQGFTGSQGVIIPQDNVDHLMLSPAIVKSVEKGEFSIYPVKNIGEALFLLTGLKPGKRMKNGGYTAGSLYNLVDRRLEQLGYYAQNAFKRLRKE